jgi:hypothetical protein
MLLSWRRLSCLMWKDQWQSQDSSVSMDVGSVENIVPVPVPVPGVVIHTLVLFDVPQEFIPPVLHDPNPLELE